MPGPESEKFPRPSETSRESGSAVPETSRTPEEIRESELRSVEDRIADLAPRTQDAAAIVDLKAGLEEKYNSEITGIQSQLGVALNAESQALIHENVMDDRVDLESGKLAEMQALMARKEELAGPADPTDAGNEKPAAEKAEKKMSRSGMSRPGKRPRKSRVSSMPTSSSAYRWSTSCRSIVCGCLIPRER